MGIVRRQSPVISENMKMQKISLSIAFLLLTTAGLYAQNITEVSTSSTPVTCGGAADGTITVEILGGNGDLNYTLFDGGVIVAFSGPTAASTYTFSGYPKSADYTVFIADSDPGTTNLWLPAAIGGPDTIDIISATTTDINCATVNDGTITVVATGEDGNLVYTLTGPVGDVNNNGFFENLPTGSYDVVVSHATCTSTDDTTGLFIDIPPLLVVNSDNISPATCYQGTDGSIEITPSGGTPSGTGTGYTYSWTGPNGFTSNNEDIFGLETGDYTVDVTDANGCVETIGPLTVGEGTEITLPVVNSSNVSCNGGTDGTATISVNGGVAPYNFSWDGQNTGLNNTAQNPANLVADTYDLTITDNVGCSEIFTGVVVITEPDPISAIVESTTNVSCFNGSDGTADVTISGGTGPYSYVWTATGPYTSTQADPTGMPADTYTLEVTDANSCVQLFPGLFSITEPQDITATINGSTDVSCFGGSNGVALVTVAQGTPGYTYVWTGDGTGHASTMEDPNDLVADTYDLQVTDANLCVKTFDNLVSIGQPADITTGISITHVDCNGDASGEIDISPSGGTSPYTYLWSGPGAFSSTNDDITGLAAGSYDLTITDAQGCTKDFNDIIVLENTAITAMFTITPLTCNGAGNGAIDANISGGTPPYSYSWSGDNGYTNNTDEDISGLDAANYTLTVTDALGCVQPFPVQPVSEPDPLTATFSHVNATCFESDDGSINISVSGGTPVYGFAWSGPNGFTSGNEDISGLEPGSYSLDITDLNSCLVSYPDEVTITEPSDITVTATATNISCNGADDGTISVVTSGGTPGYNYAWTGPNGFTSNNQNIASLEPGTYNLTVTDNNTCVSLESGIATLTEPTAITVTFTGQTNLDCFGDSNGTIDIDISGGSPPYLFSWTNELGTEVSTDEDPTGLPAGSYSLEVTDNGPCVVTYPDAVELTEPGELLTTLSKSDVICAGQSNGTITVSPTGGTAPYEHSRFSGGPYNPSATFTGLSSGTYRIYTRDASGCTTSSTIQIAEPNALNYEYGISGQNQCFGDSSVTISITNVTGGIAPYQYSIDGGGSFQTDPTFPNQPGGSYPVVVRDANMCEQAIAPLTVLEPDSLEITYYNQVDVTTCYDTPEGRIEIIGDGGTGDISYSLDGGPASDFGEFTGLIGGTYTVTLIDDRSCTRDTIVEISRPDELVVDNITITDVSGCTGDATGQLSVSASGGTGAIRYSIDGTNFNGSGNFNNLTAADYTITIEDANGCTIDSPVNLGEPLPISIDSESAQPAACFGTSTGEVRVTVSGGTPDYTYSLDPPLLPDQATRTFSGLPAGDYTITVTDSENCGPVVSGIITVTEPPELIVDSVAVVQISCNGADDGKIEVFLLGGSSPYEYSIDNEVSWSSSSSFTGLAPGTYDVYARDANGCAVFVDTYMLNDPPVLTVTALVTDVTPCFGDTNGAISATASGGWNMYEYSIDGIDFQPGGDFVDLAAGDYTIFVRDTGSCTSSVDVTIDQPEAVTATINKTNYVDLIRGTITISGASGGTPPYQYSIDGPAGTFTATTDYSDLEAGDYEVVVRDANGCTYEEIVTIFDIIPLAMVINAVDVSCFGFSDGRIEFQPQDAEGEVQYSVDDGNTWTTEPLFTDLPGDSTYNLYAYDEAGKEFTASLTLSSPEELTVFKSVSAANCNAFSETGSINLTINGGTGTKTVTWSDGSSTEDLVNVVAGEYIFTIEDENLCTLSDTAVIPALVTINAEAGKDTTICAGSTLVLDATPANVMLWEPETYLSNTGVPNPVATNISESITYTYMARETSSGFGCYDIDTLHVNVLPTYGLEITRDTFAIEGTMMQLETYTDGNFVSWQWIPETGLDDATVPDPVASILTSTTYTLIATNDNGCIETDSVFIELVEDITVYNAFSPNGDYTNDYFDIDNADKYPEILVEVYNRWGSRLFSSRGYSDEKRWDGTFNGKDVPVGTYYYVIIPYPEATPITGNVTIIR